MADEQSDSEGIHSINPEIFSPSRALPTDAGHTTQEIVDEDSRLYGNYHRGYIKGANFLPTIQSFCADGRGLFDENEALTPHGYIACDWAFHRLVAQSGNDLRLAESTLREIDFKLYIKEFEITGKESQILDVLKAKMNYAVHMYYVMGRYGESNVPNLYRYLQDKIINDGDTITSHEGMLDIANSVLEQDIAVYKALLRERTAKIRQACEEIYQQDGVGLMPRIVGKLRAVANVLGGTKRRFATSTIMGIATGALAFGITGNYKPNEQNAFFPSFNLKPPILNPRISPNPNPVEAIYSIFSDTSESKDEPMDEITGIHKSIELDISDKPTGSFPEITLPEASTDYQIRFNELLDSGCYSIHRNVTREGNIVNVLTVNPDTKNDKLCEWNVSWMRSSVPSGEKYPEERAKSRRSRSSSTFAYYMVDEGEASAYPIQIGPTCYIDSYSIASNLLRAKSGVNMQDNIVIDPAFFADIFEVPYETYVDKNTDNGNTPIDIFNLIAQQQDESGAEFKKMLNDVFGLVVEPIPLPIPGPGVNEILWQPSVEKPLVTIPTEINPADGNAYVNYLKNVFDKIYPENDETEAVIKLDLVVNELSAHSLVVVGVNRHQVRNDDGEYTGEISYELVFLEGNGGGAAEMENLKKYGAFTDEFGAVHLSLNRNTALLFNSAEVIRYSGGESQSSYAVNNLNSRLSMLGLSSDVQE